MELQFLVTAGPTREALDPVRYLSNRSSGRMGYAIAAAAAALGHRVLLVSGPTALDVPAGVDFVPVESAQEMFEAVALRIGGCAVAVFAAAVADYRPAAVAVEKVKKSGLPLTLELVPTPDILASARESFGFCGTVVGFAAETGDVERRAWLKLGHKCCDFIVANDVSRADIGFDSADNEALLVFPDHTEALPKMSKEQLAGHIVAAAILHHATRAKSSIERKGAAGDAGGCADGQLETSNLKPETFR